MHWWFDTLFATVPLSRTVPPAGQPVLVFRAWIRSCAWTSPSSLATCIHYCQISSPSIKILLGLVQLHGNRFKPGRRVPWLFHYDMMGSSWVLIKVSFYRCTSNLILLIYHTKDFVCGLYRCDKLGQIWLVWVHFDPQNRHTIVQRLSGEGCRIKKVRPPPFK